MLQPSSLLSNFKSNDLYKKGAVSIMLYLDGNKICYDGFNELIEMMFLCQVIAKSGMRSFTDSDYIDKDLFNVDHYGA